MRKRGGDRWVGGRWYLGLGERSYRQAYLARRCSGVLHLVANDNEEGIRARNSMHNRVRADAFLPAGGRPNTIDARNWQQFLVDGQPSR